MRHYQHSQLWRKVEWALARLFRLRHKVLAVGVTIAAIAILVISLDNAYERNVKHRNCVHPPVANSLQRLLRDRTAVESGHEEYLVPNLAHFYRFGAEASQLTVMDVICLIAVHRHQRPDQLFIHTDDVQAVRDSFTSSHYGSQLWSIPGFQGVLTILEYPTPRHVFGIPFSKEYEEMHIRDIVRLRILRKYGGIFLDNNIYLIQNADELRKEELTVTFSEDAVTLDNCLLLAHRDSRLLNSWLKSYVHYSPRLPHHHHSSQVVQLVSSAHRSLVRVSQLLSQTPSAHQFYAVRLSPKSSLEEGTNRNQTQVERDLMQRFFPL